MTMDCAYIPVPGLAPDDCLAAITVGDSMAPEYPHDTPVVFSLRERARDGDDCYILMADGRPTFKRVKFLTGDRVKLSPLNKAFKPKTVNRADVDAIYPAVFALRPTLRR